MFLQRFSGSGRARADFDSRRLHHFPATNRHRFGRSNAASNATRWGLVLAAVLLSACAEHVVVPQCGAPDGGVVAPDAPAVCDGASGALADEYYTNERLVVGALCSRTDPDATEACVERAALPGLALEDCLVAALSCRPEVVEGLSCLLDTQVELLVCVAAAVDDQGLSTCIATRARAAVACHVPAIEACSAAGS